MPYYVGGLIESRDELIVNTPQKYSGLTGVEVVSQCEVTKVCPDCKKIIAVKDGVTIEETYDKLIIATGATPVVPNMVGKNLPGVFCMRTPGDAVTLRDYVKDNSCHSAMVVGAGFIGLEVAKNLKAQGLAVTVVDAANQIMPNAFDEEMADYAKRRLKEAGMRIITGTRILEVLGDTKATGIKTNNGNFMADVVVLAIGVRPATDFLVDTGIEMVKGAIVTDEHMCTNLPDVYAAGDCALVHNMLTGKQQWSAMGSTANISARVLAQHMMGKNAVYGGCLGTGVAKLLDNLNVGRTGLTETQAKEAGYQVETVVCITDDKAHYYPGASFFATKLIADKNTRKLLGMQVIGAGAVDKMVDIAVTGLAAGMRIDDFDTLDYAYAPAFSTAIHPFVQACCILENKMAGELEPFTPAEYAAGLAKEYKVIDVLPEAGIAGAQWVNLAKVDGPLPGIEKTEKLLLVCARGKRGYFLQNRLKHFGYTNTKVLEGGATFNTVKVPVIAGSIPAAEIKRVKGLGCLQDKRYPDRFC